MKQTKTELMKKMNELEKENEALLKEITAIDRLMRKVGFTDGIKTVKATALEIYQNNARKRKKKDDFYDSE